MLNSEYINGVKMEEEFCVQHPFTPLIGSATTKTGQCNILEADYELDNQRRKNQKNEFWIITSPKSER